VSAIGVVVLLTQAHVWGPWVDGVGKPECAKPVTKKVIV